MMKRVICLLLAALMVLSMTACQSDNKTEEPQKGEENAATAAPAENNTGAPAPEDTGFQAEASLTENSTTMTFETPAEYEAFLHELGYTEYRGDLYRHTEDCELCCHPVSLTYNEEAFKLVFDYINMDYEANELVLQEGWVLYGAKNAAEPANISPYRANDFDFCDMFDLDAEMPELANGYVHQVQYMFYNEENDLPTCLMTSTAFYYPATGNLYNLAYEHENPMVGSTSDPSVLCMSKEDESNFGYGFGDPVVYVELGYVTLLWGGSNVHYPFKPGMTLADWVNSEYNDGGWTVDENHVVWSSDGGYYIENADKDIRELGIGEDLNVTITATKK